MGFDHVALGGFIVRGLRIPQSERTINREAIGLSRIKCLHRLPHALTKQTPAQRQSRIVWVIRWWDMMLVMDQLLLKVALRAGLHQTLLLQGRLLTLDMFPDSTHETLSQKPCQAFKSDAPFDIPRQWRSQKHFCGRAETKKIPIVH